ncbi:hypothetical protein AB0E12_25540 [Micromonospora chersina]|uniref:hypothetical protein n=1 Tax=Micromonospora chersina TaxID=47854 RepID=UPI0033D4E06E
MGRLVVGVVVVDVGALVDAAWPYLAAVVRGYGSALVQRVTDESVDASAGATVSLGRRLWRRLFGSAEAPAVEAAVLEATEHPGDADYLAGLRLQVKKALAADEALAGDLAGLLRSDGVTIVAAGEGSAAVHTNTGIISTGDNATNSL